MAQCWFGTTKRKPELESKLNCTENGLALATPSCQDGRPILYSKDRQRATMLMGTAAAELSEKRTLETIPSISISDQERHHHITITTRSEFFIDTTTQTYR